MLPYDKELLDTFGKFIQYHWAPESLSPLKSNDCYAFGILLHEISKYELPDFGTSKEIYS